jgi:hypothetical protein
VNTATGAFGGRARCGSAVVLAVVTAATLTTSGVPVHHAALVRSSASWPATVPPAVLTAPVAAPGPLPDGSSVDLSGSPTRAPSLAGIPTEVDIPTINVHAPVVPLGLGPDGTVQVPDSFTAAGWYQGGPRPGDTGPAVILGHVDSFDGPAVFFRLKDLSPGQLIDVASASGSRQFQVDTVMSFPKDHFPTAMVYGPVPVPALRLVTCGGSFDKTQQSYRDNVVVFATEVSP